MNNELISIIVPIYNASLYLEKCVNSILNQTYSNLEILLIDDGSTDNSLEICMRYAKTDCRVIVIHKTNGGQASARNEGLDIAKGNYIGFVDSDDWVEPSMFEVLYYSIGDNDISMCGRYNVNEKTYKISKSFCIKEKKVFKKEEAIKRFLLSDNIDGACWDKLFKKELLRELRFPLGYICEDLPFIYQSLLKCSSIVHVGKPLYYYLQRNGSTSRSSFNDKTYGLIKYSSAIRDDVKKRYPKMKKEADEYFSFCLVVYLIKYTNSENTQPLQIKYRLSDFSHLSLKYKFIAFLIRFRLYKFVKRILKK